MSGVLLRRAEIADAVALAGLEAEASPHPWSPALVLAEVERTAPDEVLVLDSRAGIVAYCATRLAVEELQLMNLAVHPRARRRGLARALLAAALRRAARAGARRALLEVRAGNDAARALYAECGFVLLGRRRDYYSEPVEDALVLVREPLAEGAQDRRP